MAMAHLTSTTAPNKKFASREELAQHYKSDWHRYNLKRREANLHPVTEQEFKARLEAALAMRKQKNLNNANNDGGVKGNGKTNRGKTSSSIGNHKGRDHLKDKSQVPPSKKKNSLQKQNNPNKIIYGDSMDEDETVKVEDENEEEEEVPTIDPLCSLFDDHMSNTLEENIQYMNTNYGFFIPDREFLTDTEGLIGYSAEKVLLGHICLYCQKAFQSGKDVQKHMIAKGHCKLRYEEGVDLDEWEVFYDFSEDNDEFLKQHNSKKRDEISKRKNTENADTIGVVTEEEDDEEEWEDISDDDNDNDDDEDYDEIDGYRDAIKSQGFGVTELGELILPSGKIIGHRTLAKYYNQKFAPEPTGTRQTAVQAALKDIHGYGDSYYSAITSSTSTATKTGVGISGRLLQSGGGGSGKGILVAAKGGGFSTVSMYRYRAAVRKAHKGEARWHRHQGKVRNNGNKFDKKGNRLITGVSVAHAKR